MIIDENLSVSTVTPETIRYIVEKIARTVHPSTIILFGSHARHENDTDSDIDLLVITGPGQDREQVRLEIERNMRGRRFSIDLLVRTPDDVKWNLEAENPFYTNDIFRDGEVMYEC
jgi:uncharacterized protein